MLNLSNYKVLTFDCYGTLIDWETGILNALMPLLEQHGVHLSADEILRHYAEFESALEAGSYRPYRQILAGVVQQFGERFGFTPSEAEQQSLPDSVQDWPAFADTVAALQQLHQTYKLVILSNVDDSLFAQTNRRLVQFYDVVTAEQVQSYKPSLNNFNTLIQRAGVPSQQILHVAASLYHDIVPASSLGLATVWVNRRHDQTGSGAAPEAAGKADLVVPDLQTLADLVQAGS
ncbi:MAG: haloacid dehalogenase type II [Elainella sp.]